MTPSPVIPGHLVIAHEKIPSWIPRLKDSMSLRLLGSRARDDHGSISAMYFGVETSSPAASDQGHRRRPTSMS